MLTNLNKINAAYVPVSALIVYKKIKDNNYYTGDLPQYFITKHDVSGNGDIGAGSPVTEKFMRNIAGELDPLEYLHERIIAKSAGKVVWWTPATVAYVKFTNTTNIMSGIYPLPPMLFKLDGNELYNWALKESIRPKQETMLFRSPFFNIHGSGKCCMGNIKTIGLNNIEEWEKAFIGGTCTNELPPTFKNGRTPKDVWDNLVGKNKFPVSCLVSTGISVAQIIKR